MWMMHLHVNQKSNYDYINVRIFWVVTVCLVDFFMLLLLIFESFGEYIDNVFVIKVLWKKMLKQ